MAMRLRSGRLTQDQKLSVDSDGVKTNGSTVQKNKGGLRGRKSLANSVKTQQGLKKKVEKKSSIAVAEDEDEDEKLSLAIEEELRFQHNHEECIKSQNISMYLRRLAYINEINEGKPRYLSAELALKLSSEAQLKSKSEDDRLFEIPEVNVTLVEFEIPEVNVTLVESRK